MVDHSEGKLQGGRQRQHLNCTLEEGSRLGEGHTGEKTRRLGAVRFGGEGWVEQDLAAVEVVI